MPYLLGTDEAGYGPNLGPLVITLTCWQVENATTDLSSVFAPCVGAGPDQIRLQDSKQVFQSQSKSLLHLERTALSLLQQIGIQVHSVSELIHALSRNAASFIEEGFWTTQPEIQLPQHHEREQLDTISRSIANQLAKRDCRLTDVKSRLISPPEFNELLRQQNKATLLSRSTLELVAEVCDELQQVDPREDILITCDRFGGRRKYMPLIQEVLTESFVQRVQESASESIYRICEAERTITIRFVTQGEQFAAVAASSIFSKWIRELTMLAWNSFWREHLPDLKATAGYPTDAPRFKSEIEEVQRSLGIADKLIWREK